MVNKCGFEDVRGQLCLVPIMEMAVGVWNGLAPTESAGWTRRKMMGWEADSDV